MSVQQADSSDMARFIYLSDGTKVGAVRGYAARQKGQRSSTRCYRIAPMSRSKVQ